jgi:hypothetical protein
LCVLFWPERFGHPRVDEERQHSCSGPSSKLANFSQMPETDVADGKNIGDDTVPGDNLA